MWLLSRILSFDSTRDYHILQNLCKLIRSDDQDMADFFRSKQSSKDYISLHSELKEDDQATEQVAMLERDYFRGDSWRQTVSRELTLVSQWSSRYQEQ